MPSDPLLPAQHYAVGRPRPAGCVLSKGFLPGEWGYAQLVLTGCSPCPYALVLAKTLESVNYF